MECKFAGATVGLGAGTEQKLLCNIMHTRIHGPQESWRRKMKGVCHTFLLIIGNCLPLRGKRTFFPAGTLKGSLCGERPSDQNSMSQWHPASPRQDLMASYPGGQNQVTPAFLQFQQDTSSDGSVNAVKY